MRTRDKVIKLVVDGDIGPPLITSGALCTPPGPGKSTYLLLERM
jgi:hypothetical protein